MNYEELQEKAKTLGLKKYVGVSKRGLEQYIAQAEANRKVSTESDAQKEEANTAAVFDKGNQEIRRYTLQTHGENFLGLAKQFANDGEYTVRLLKVKPGVPCPSCGYVIYPDEV